MAKKQPLALILILVCALVGLFGMFFWLDQRDPGRSDAQKPGKTVEEMMRQGEEDALPVYHNGEAYVKNPNLESYLILGVDQLGEAQASGSYNGGGQSDVILVLVADHTREQVSLLQINRDTMTEVEVLGVRGDVVGTRTEQIASAHAYGTGMKDSCENAVRAVSRLLYDTHMDGYASIRMEAMPVLNDLLGGVTVPIEDDFSQVDPSLIQGEMVTLQGEQVLHFIRDRLDVGDGTNLERMKRHRAYLSAFRDAMEQQMEKDPDLLLRMYDAVMPYVITDTGSGTVSQLAQKCGGYANHGIVTIEGETRQGELYVEFYADELSIKEAVLNLFYIKQEP